MSCVYSLSDPRSGEIRYVGGTTRPPEVRLLAHINDSKRGNAWKDHWVMSLLQDGVIPKMSILEAVDGPFYAAERSWIHFLRQVGFNLTNLTDGGEGTVGRITREETRLKQSAARKSRVTTQETTVKMSLARKGLVFSEERKAKMRFPKSNEHKTKIGLGNKGKVHSTEWVANNVASHKAKLGGTTG